MIFRRAVDLKVGDYIIIAEKPFAVTYIRGIANNLIIGIKDNSEIAVSIDDYFEISIKSLSQKAIELNRKIHD